MGDGSDFGGSSGDAGRLFTPLVIVTHVDVVPQFTAPAIELLWVYRGDSLKDAGVHNMQVLQQVGRPNHFTIVEEWEDEAAYDKHVSAEHTRLFRGSLQPMLGAPYDERPHSVIKSELGPFLGPF